MWNKDIFRQASAFSAHVVIEIQIICTIYLFCAMYFNENSAAI